MLSLINIILKKFKKKSFRKKTNVQLENTDLSTDSYLNCRCATIIKGTCNHCNKETVLIGEEKICINCIKETSKNYTSKELDEIEEQIKNFMIANNISQ